MLLRINTSTIDRFGRWSPRTVAAVRVLVGFAVLHQQLGLVGFSSLAGSDAAAIFRPALVAAVLGAALLAGVLTPVVTLALIYYYALRVPVPSLGTRVAVVALWGLLLFGAGASHSVDALLRRWGPTRRLWGFLYGLAPVRPEGLALARLVVLGVYWGQCLSAMGQHWVDPNWRQGTVLERLYTTPYWTDHYAWFTALRTRGLLAFKAMCVLALAFQMVWEALLLPLVWLRVTRPYAVIFGWVFLLLSLLTINLGYLPVYECCMWLLLFGPAQSKLVMEPEPAPSSLDPGKSGRDLFIRTVAAAAGLAILVIQFSSNPVVLQGLGRPPERLPLPTGLRGLAALFGQGPVNVFNGTDLGAGRTVLVVEEVDANRCFLRLVPYMDDQGGRLDYLRNDVLLYRLSIPWHRGALESSLRWDLPRPGGATEGIVGQIALLDARLHPRSGKRRYRARVFVRQWTPDSLSAPWSSTRELGALDVDIGAGKLAQSREDAPWAFSLPPGHIGSAFRSLRTVRTLTASSGGGDPAGRLCPVPPDSSLD